MTNLALYMYMDMVYIWKILRYPQNNGTHTKKRSIYLIYMETLPPGEGNEA